MSYDGSHPGAHLELVPTDTITRLQAGDSLWDVIAREGGLHATLAYRYARAMLEGIQVSTSTCERRRCTDSNDVRSDPEGCRALSRGQGGGDNPSREFRVHQQRREGGHNLHPPHQLRRHRPIRVPELEVRGSFRIPSAWPAGLLTLVKASGSSPGLHGTGGSQRTASRLCTVPRIFNRHPPGLHVRPSGWLEVPMSNAARFRMTGEYAKYGPPEADGASGLSYSPAQIGKELERLRAGVASKVSEKGECYCVPVDIRLANTVCKFYRLRVFGRAVEGRGVRAHDVRESTKELAEHRQHHSATSRHSESCPPGAQADRGCQSVYSKDVQDPKRGVSIRKRRLANQGRSLLEVDS